MTDTIASTWPQPPFAHRGWRSTVAIALGCGAVGLDLTLFRDQAIAHGPIRPGTGMLVLIAFVLLGGGARELGLRALPMPSLRYWRNLIAIYAAACAALIVVVGIGAHVLDVPIRARFTEAREIWPFALSACLHAPVTEELLYRAALCAPLVAGIGRWPTILVSSLAFSYLHVRWGNFEVSHPIGGAINAWAYLRSGSLWVPIALHTITNLLGVAAYAILFYLGSSN